MYQGNYVLKEISTNPNYILSEKSFDVNVEYNQTNTQTITNEHKKGNIKVYKIDKDNKKVVLGNVEFKLYSEEFKKIIGTYYTDVNGELEIKNLRTGNYKLIETKTNKWYNLANDTEIKVEWDKETTKNIENELKKGQVKVIKVDKDNNEVYNESLGNIDTELIKTKELAAGQTMSYTVYLTYNGKEDNYGLTANLIAYKELIKKDRKTLKELILANNNLSQLQTNIGEVATNPEGLIEVQNDTASTYYFRGSVTNNYVKFANVMFRIVRINEDGSVRLITDNLLDNKAPYKKTVSDIEDAGNVLLSTSTIKETLDDFYNNTLSDYQKYVVDSNFCSENTYYIEEENKKLFTSYNRVINESTASLSCSGTLEQAKVGLLSIDEAIYAGASKNGTNTSYYLYNPNITSTWWTLTGSQVLLNNNAVDNFAIGITGEVLSETKITSNQGIRPVISLDKTVSASGSGTYEDPYVIE